MSAHRLWMKSGASGRAVNLNHAPVEDNRNEDRHDFEAQTDQKRFYRQSEQFSDAHVLHAGTHLRNRRVNVNARVAVDYSCCTGNTFCPMSNTAITMSNVCVTR